MWDHINEQVLAEWTDMDSGRARTLGSLSVVNKQDAGLSFRIGLDSSQEQAFIRFSMDVSVKVSGRHRRRQLVLVLPLHVLCQKNPALEYDMPRISDLGKLAPVVHEAGLSDSGYVIRAEFNLREPGYVLMPKTNAKSLRPSTSTAANHLASIESLSRALNFTLYIKPSDYARQGLKMICEHLNDDTLKQYPLQWDHLFDGHGAQLVDWEQCEFSAKGKEAEAEAEVEMEDAEPPPPPYVSDLQEHPPRTPSPFEFPPSPDFIPPFALSPADCTPSAEVLVERSSTYSSPREILSAAESQFESDACTIPNTPDCLPEIVAYLRGRTATATATKQTAEPASRKRRATSTPVVSPASSSDNQADPPKRACTTSAAEGLQQALLHQSHPTPSFASTPPLLPAFASTPTQKDPSPTYYAPTQQDPSPTAALNLTPTPSRPPCLSPPPPPPPPTTLPDTLLTHLSTFTARALAHNPTAYAHSALRPLLLRAGHAARVGDAERFRALRAAMTVAFVLDPLDEGKCWVGEWVRKDMEGLVGWMLGVDGVADVVCWGEVWGVGVAARGAEVEEYRWRKGVCVGAVCVAFGEGEGV